MKCLKLLKLQRDHNVLQQKYTESQITINSDAYINNNLRTMLAMKDQEIDDLKETLILYTPKSPPDLNSLAAIFEPPELNLKQSTNVQDVDDEKVKEVEKSARVYKKKRDRLRSVSASQIRPQLYGLFCF